MPDGKKTYKVNGQTYDIPEDKVDAFLSKYPNAQPLESYIVDKDTFDIPTDKVAAFKKKFPNAKPTFGTVKKKDDTGGIGAAYGTRGGMPSISPEKYTPKPQGSGLEAPSTGSDAYENYQLAIKKIADEIGGGWWLGGGAALSDDELEHYVVEWETKSKLPDKKEINDYLQKGIEPPWKQTAKTPSQDIPPLGYTPQAPMPEIGKVGEFMREGKTPASKALQGAGLKKPLEEDDQQPVKSPFLTEIPKGYVTPTDQAPYFKAIDPYADETRALKTEGEMLEYKNKVVEQSVMIQKDINTYEGNIGLLREQKMSIMEEIRRLGRFVPNQQERAKIEELRGQLEVIEGSLQENHKQRDYSIHAKDLLEKSKKLVKSNLNEAEYGDFVEGLRLIGVKDFSTMGISKLVREWDVLGVKKKADGIREYQEKELQPIVTQIEDLYEIYKPLVEAYEALSEDLQPLKEEYDAAKEELVGLKKSLKSVGVDTKPYDEKIAQYKELEKEVVALEAELKELEKTGDQGAYNALYEKYEKKFNKADGVFKEAEALKPDDSEYKKKYNEYSAKYAAFKKIEADYNAKIPKDSQQQFDQLKSISDQIDALQETFKTKSDGLESLTDPEANLLDVYGLFNELRDRTNSIAFNVGSGVSEMVPYIVQFWATGGSATAVRLSIEKAVLKGLGAKVKKEIIKKGITKSLGYMVGAASRVPLMTMPYEDYPRRRIAGEDPLQALRNAGLTTYAEVFTEGLGGSIKAKSIIGKTLGKDHNLFKYLTKVEQNTPEVWKEIQSRAGWNGVFGQYGEEVANTFLQPAITDDELKLDLNEQIVTLLTVATFGGPISVYKAGATGLQMRKEFRNQTENIAKRIRPDVLKAVDKALENPMVEQIAADVTDVLMDKRLSKSERDDIVKYVAGRTGNKSVAEIKQEQDDTKDETGIPGKEQVGQEPVKEEPIKETGEEKAEAGGVLQKEELTQDEKVAEKKAEATEVAPGFRDKRIADLYGTLNEEDKETIDLLIDGGVDEERISRKIKKYAQKTIKGNKLIERQNAEDTLNNPNAPVAERVAAEYSIKEDMPFNGAQVSDVQKVINSIESGDALSVEGNKINNIYQKQKAEATSKFEKDEPIIFKKKRTDEDGVPYEEQMEGKVIEDMGDKVKVEYEDEGTTKTTTYLKDKVRSLKEEQPIKKDAVEVEKIAEKDFVEEEGDVAAPEKTQQPIPLKKEAKPVAKKVKIGDKVELPPREGFKTKREMEYTEEGWKENVGEELTEVSKEQQADAQKEFDAVKQPTISPEKEGVSQAEKKAFEFAERKHKGQKRKYTGDEYIEHPKQVAEKLRESGASEEHIIAALLHDTVEDTETTIEEVRKEFGDKVANLVEELTDIYTKEAHPDKNRKARKKAEAERLSKASPEAQTIKLADMINNTSSIVENDEKFGKVYIEEAEALLAALTKGDKALQKELREVLDKAKKDLQKPTTEKTSGVQKEEKIRANIEAQKAKIKALRDKKKTQGIAIDPKQEAQDMYDMHKAYVSLAKSFIELGINKVEDFAKELGVKLNDVVKRAWDEASSGNVVIKDVKYFEKQKDDNKNKKRIPGDVKGQQESIEGQPDAPESERDTKDTGLASRSKEGEEVSTVLKTKGKDADLSKVEESLNQEVYKRIRALNVEVTAEEAVGVAGRVKELATSKQNLTIGKLINNAVREFKEARELEKQGKIKPLGVEIKVNKKASGSGTTSPSASYNHAVEERQESTGDNLWVRQSEDKSNADRVLMVQFSSEFLYGERKISDKDKSSLYFDKLYKVITGYDRTNDFWEVPLWMARIANIEQKGDVYVIRNIEEFNKFVKEAGYKRILFSGLDVNKEHIQSIVEGNKNQKFSIGGYTNFKDLKKQKNATIYESVEEYASQNKVKDKQGYSYRHFRNLRVIPRLKLSEGCKYKCAFCGIPERVRSMNQKLIDNQIDSIRDLDGQLVYLDDKTFGQADNFKKLPAIFKKIKEYNPGFQGFIIQTTSIDFANKKKFSKEFLKASGIKYVELGVETYNDDILTKVRKKHSHKKHTDAAMQNARENGVEVIPNIIVGMAWEEGENVYTETKETYQNTMGFLNANKDIISHINVYALALYEGTELGDSIEARAEADKNENIIKKSWQENPELHEWAMDEFTDMATKQIEDNAAKTAPKIKTKEDKLRSNIEAQKAKIKELRDKRKNQGIAADPKQDAQDMYDMHKAYVSMAKSFIELGVSKIEEFAKELGEKINDTIKRAWDEASTGEVVVKGVEYFEKETIATKPEKEVKVKGEKEPIGVTNAYTEAMRAALGKDPLAATARQENSELWDKVSDEIAEGLVDPKHTVSKIAEDPNPPVNDELQAIVLFDRIRITNEREILSEMLNRAFESGDKKMIADLVQRSAELETEGTINDIANTKLSRTWGRAGQFRQRLAERDFSLAGLIERAKNTNFGKDIALSLEAKLGEIAKKYKALQKEHSALLEKQQQLLDEKKKKESEIRKEIEQKIIEDLKKKAVRDRGKEKAKRTRAKGKEIADRIRKAKLSAQPFVFSTVVPPKIIDAAFEIIAKSVEKSADLASAIQEGMAYIRATDWYKKLTTGEKSLFKDKYKEYINNLYKKLESTKELDEEFEGLVEKLVEKSEGVLHEGLKGIVDKMVYNRVKSGMKTIDEVVDSIYDAIGEDLVGLDKRDLRDLISGYGKFKELSKQQIDQEVRELKRIGRLTSALEDVLKGKLPKRSGVERDKPTQTVRQKQAEILRIIKEKGLEPDLTEEEIEAQWRSAEKAYHTRLENAIADIEKEIRTRQRKATSKRREFNDPRSIALREELARLKKQRDEELGKPSRKLTAEQRANMAIKALEKVITQIEEGIENLRQGKTEAGEIYPEKRSNHDKLIDKRVEQLREKRDALKQEREDLLPQGVKDKAIIEKYTKSRERRLKFLQEKLKNKDFAPRAKKETPPLTDELRNLNKEIHRLEEEVAKEMEKLMLANRENWEVLGDIALDMWNLSKVLMASVDFSAPLRQGLFLIGKPLIFGRAFVEMFRQAFSQKRYDQWMEDLKEMPEFYEMKHVYKLYIAEQSAKLAAKEEAYMSNFLKYIYKVPKWALPVWAYTKLIQGSERAYTGFLNKQRVDTFLAFKNALEDEGFSGEELKKELTAYAGFVNNATGRGKLHTKFLGKDINLESFATVLNGAFFSPRLITSRLALLNPAYYYKMPPKTQRDALKSLAKLIGIGVSTLVMISMDDDWEVEYDPRSSDFGKAVKGNVRFDIWGGFQQPIRTMAQIFTNSRKNLRTGEVTKMSRHSFPSQTQGSTARMFFVYKLSPSASLLWGIFNDKTTAVGEQMTWGNQAFEKTVPLYMQDMGEILQEEGVDVMLNAAIPALFGVGIQYHSKNVLWADDDVKEFLKEHDEYPSKIQKRPYKVDGKDKEPTNKEMEEYRELAQSIFQEKIRQYIKDKEKFGGEFSKETKSYNGIERTEAQIVIYKKWDQAKEEARKQLWSKLPKTEKIKPKTPTYVP